MNLRRGITLAACLATGLFLSLPLACTIGRPAWEGTLGGVEEAVPFPPFSWNAWFSGAWSRDAELWLNRNIGLRTFLIKAGSQANYSLFGRIRREAEGQTLILGREGWLFRQDYIDVLKRRKPKGDVRKLAGDLVRVHSLLASNGVAFVFVIAPNKAFVCRDRLGTKEADGLRPGWSASLAESLRKQGVPVVEGNALFETEKGRHPFLFPPGGIHWSYDGAWVAWDAAAAAAGPGTFAVPPVRSVAWAPPAGLDSDLRDLLNLWWFEPGGPARLPYPVVEPDGPPRHGALVVGDSFSFGLIDAMARSGSFRRLGLVYYGRSFFEYPRTTFPSRDERILFAGLTPGKESNPWKQKRYDTGLPTRKKPFFPAVASQWGKARADANLVAVVVSEVNLEQAWLSDLVARMAEPGAL